MPAPQRRRRDPATIYEDFVGTPDFREAVNVPAFRTSFDYYYDKPVQFVEDIIQPDDPVQKWQADFLESIRDNKKCACASCQGAGKTAAVAWAILWFAATRPKSKVICTAPGKDLLNGVLWAELYKWITHSNKLGQIFDWTATKITHKGRDEFGRPYAPNWFILARTTTAHHSENGEIRQAEGLAGFHADHLLFVIDEASGIPPEHFKTAEGTLTGYENKIVVIGNPVRTDGRFYDIFNDDNVSQTWVRFNVSALPNGTYIGPDGPEKLEHVTYVSDIADKKDARDAIRELGLNHFDVQARKLGRFPEKHSTDTGFTVAEITEAQKRTYTVKPEDEVQIGVDCARFGDDEMVIMVRRGFKITRTVIRAKSAVNEIIGLVTEAMYYEAQETLRLRGVPLENQTEDQIKLAMNQITVVVDEADAGGGGGVCDLMWANGFGNVIGVHFGESAMEFDKYGNLAAEMWLGFLKDMMKDLDLSGTIEGDNGQMCSDMKLRRQLTVRRYKYTGKGQQKVLESKDEMRRRKVNSPDRADALCLACVVPPSPGVF
jgi:phage terminase large subunit